MATKKVMRSDFSRVFILENRAGPNIAPSYQGQMKAGAISWSQGDITVIRQPSSERYGAFDIIGKIPGEIGNPTLPLTARFSEDVSELLRLTRKGCDNDFQVHLGECGNPSDFNGGWNKVLMFDGGSITEYGTDDLGALDTSERAVVTENVSLTGEDYYEVKRMLYSETAAAHAEREVVDIVVCDSITCGTCGLPSDGCQHVFALVRSSGAGSPGVPAEVIYTQDGGGVWGDSPITTLSATADADAMACVGSNLVVVSNADDSLHYASIVDLLNGDGVWTEVTNGIVAAGSPKAIFSAGSTATWIVGDGGYVYFSADPTSGVTVQDAGNATAQNLLAVTSIDEDTVVAVGESNAVIYTLDGGASWAAVTGPAAGIALNTVAMLSRDVWLVGTADGKLYYTINAGVSWTEKTFPGSGTGEVRDLQFVTRAVGFMAHDADSVGFLLRTIDGGNSWYRAPEGSATLPTQERLNALAVCDNANTVFAGGLGTGSTDGVVIKGS